MRAKYYGAYGNNPNGSFFGGQNPNGYGGYGQSSNNQTSNQSPFSEFEEKAFGKAYSVL